MKHFFEAIDGWFDYADLYEQVVAETEGPAHFLELGTWKGRSAAFMGVEIINSGKEILLDTVDHFIGVEPRTNLPVQRVRFVKSYREALENLRPVMNVVRIIPVDTAEAAGLYEDNSLDFVFIDGNHARPFVTKDIHLWYPKVKSGGIFAGHDYTSHIGVKRAVDAVFPRVKQVSEKCWMIRKP